MHLDQYDHEYHEQDELGDNSDQYDQEYYEQQDEGGEDHHSTHLDCNLLQPLHQLWLLSFLDEPGVVGGLPENVLLLKNWQISGVVGGLPQFVVLAVQLVLEGPDLVPAHLDMVPIRLESQSTAHLVLEAPDRLHLAVHQLNSSAPHLCTVCLV